MTIEIVFRYRGISPSKVKREIEALDPRLRVTKVRKANVDVYAEGRMEKGASVFVNFTGPEYVDGPSLYEMWVEDIREKVEDDLGVQIVEINEGEA